MKKKAVSAVLAAVMMFALMGCSVSKTVTKTETVTDANGKTTTTTTITTSQNGKKTESTTVEESSEPADDSIVATLSFENLTSVDIYALKFSSAQSDNWGEDVLGDFAPLEDGETISFNNRFTYHTDNVLWDLKIADENDHTLEFEGLDLSLAADPENITIVLTYNDADNTFSATVE